MKITLLVSAVALALAPVSVAAAMKCTGDACKVVSVEDHYLMSGKTRVNNAIFRNSSRKPVTVGYSTLLGAMGCSGTEQQTLPVTRMTAATTPLCGDSFTANYGSSSDSKTQ